MTWRNHQLRLFGHRGAPAHLPENTMESFHRALAYGATALELDVHLTRDGQLVVSHDPDGTRTAGRAELIRDSSLEEIEQWNVAEGCPVATGCTMRMPVLSEVIRAFPSVPITVDIKPEDSQVATSILETVRSLDAESRITVGSFHGHQVRRLRRLGYRGPTALTRSEVAITRFLPRFICRLAVRGQAAMIPLRHGSIRLDVGAFIRRCRRLGLRVDFWVVNEPAAARALLSAGATGIVTDDPQRLAPLLSEFG